MSAGLDTASDVEIWDFAEKNNFVIVTKDNDFLDMSALYGSPPKVIFLNIGNCTLRYVEALLKDSSGEIIRFLEDRDSSLLEITKND